MSLVYANVSLFVSGFGHIKFIHNLFDAQREFSHTQIKDFQFTSFAMFRPRKFDLHIFAINSIPLISISIKYPSAHSDQFSPSHMYTQQQIRLTFVAPFPIFRFFFSGFTSALQCVQKFACSLQRLFHTFFIAE